MTERRGPELEFSVESVAPAREAATPYLVAKLRIKAAGEPVHSVALRTQVQIEPQKRRYAEEERPRLVELFGEPERWSQTLRPLLWTNLSTNISAFTADTTVDLLLPCTFDFNIAMTKYVAGLDDGELPTSFLFSGTVFYSGHGGLQIAQIPWDREARFRIPVQTWKEMMDSYYPNAAWLCIRREVFDQLYAYKTKHGILTWEQVLERVLASAAAGNRS
jgi:hypothetical protein